MGLPQSGYVPYVGSNINVTNFGAFVAMHELVRVTIPPLPGLVRLDGKINLQATAAGTQSNFLAGIGPAGFIALTQLDGGGYNLVGGPSGANAEPEARPGFFTAFLPPNSPGDYVLGAVRKVTGDPAGVMVGTSIIKSWLAWQRVS
jgi:hypothetical protein